MRSLRSNLRRPASALAAIGSLLVFATCDLDKITATKQEGGAQPSLNFSISGGNEVILAGTTTLSVSPQFDNIVQRWSSSAPNIASVDSLTGVVTGVSIGPAQITARLLGMELDTGVTKTHSMLVRYKGIKVAAIDSINGLGLTRAVTINGTNNLNVVQAAAISGATLTIHDSGSTAQTVASLSGQTVKGLKNGVAYVKAVFETTLIDSVKVKVRQVAKNVTFPAAVGTPPQVVVNSLNINRTMVAAVQDQADSTIVNPVLTWAVLDTTVATIGATTGVLRAKKIGTTTLNATSDGIMRSVALRVQQIAAAVAKDLGDNQTGGINSSLAVAPRVIVTDSGGAAVAGAQVLFEVVTGGGSVTAATQTTSATGVATVGGWTLGPIAGAQTLKATSGTGSATFTATATPGPAARLAFTIQPSSQTSNTALNPAVRVAIVDSAGNTVTTATNAVTVAIGANPGSATLGGTLTVNAVSGVAVFSDLTLSAVGTGYTLAATSGSLASTASNSFNIFGPAVKLGFVRQPSNGVIARAIAPSVQVAVQDAQGNTVTSATNSITLAFGTNAGGATAVLSGTRTVAAVNGVATFADLSINVAANGYTLSAASTGLTAATSAAFNILPVGAAARLMFLTEPTNTVSTQPINAATTPVGIRVAVVDSGGATITGSTQQITLSILNNAGVSGSLSGTTQQAAASGIATFTGLNINRAGTGYTLLAIAAGTSLGSDTSAAFNITVGVASKLGFVVQPTNINVSQTMSPAVQVAVQDAGGNTVTGTSHQVTLAASSGALTGTTVQTVGTNGIATFSTLSHATAANNYTLTATSAPVLTSAVSTTFNVVAAGGAVKLNFLAQPSNATAGASIAPAIQVEVTDGAGARVTAGTYNITLAIGANPGNSTIGGSLTQASASGIATFSNINLTKAGSGYTLSASAPSLTSGTSQGFNITHGAATRVGFVGQPGNVTAGVAISPAVTVAVQDDNGNTVFTSNATVEARLEIQNPCCTNLNGTVLVAASNGISTFSNLRIPRAGTYSLSARIQGSTTFSTNSATFVVSSAPAVRLAFAQQPGNTVAGSAIAAMTVQVQDSLGNIITTATNPVTLAIAQGPAGGALNGTQTVNAVNGIATFSDISINKASDRSPINYQLAASAAGLGSSTSNNFNINAGTPSKLLWTRPAPEGAIRNTVLNTSLGAPAVSLADQFDNPTGSATSSSVTVAFGANPGTATLGGTKTKSTDGGGNAFFDDLTISAAGTGYTLTASATGMVSATTVAFNVAAFGAANKLGFTVNPANSLGGQKIAPAVQVAVQDQAGNTVTSHPATSITLHLNQNPGSGFLSGTLTGTTASGLVTFDSVVVDRAANGYVLGACVTSGCSLFGASNAFNVTVGPAAKLSFEPQQPTNTTGGVAFNPAIKVAVTDLGGNTVTSAVNSITVSITPGTGQAGAILSGTATQPAASGIATFNGLSIDKSACYTFDANATGLTKGVSNGFCVNVGPAAKLGFITQPTNTFVNAPINPNATVGVEVQDAGGNRIFDASANNSITLSLSANPGGATLGGTKTVSAINGSAGFPDVTLDKVASGYTVSASATGLTPVTSVAFNVAAFSTANKLVWKVQPGTVTARTTIAPAMELHVTDQYGNTVTSGTGSTQSMDQLHFVQSPAGATLEGTTFRTAVAGVAKYDDIKIGSSGTGFVLRVCSNGPVFGCYNTESFNVSDGIFAYATGLTNPYNLVKATTDLFWIETGTNSSVKRTSSTPGSGITTLQISRSQLQGIATDGTDIYMTEVGNSAGSNLAESIDGKILRMNSSTGAITELAINLTSLRDQIEVDATYVYFVSRVAGQMAIRKVPKAGSAVSNVVVNASSTTVPYFTLSGSTIYYTDGAGAIFNIPAAGGISTFEASGNPRSLIRVGTNLCWTEAAAGQIRCRDNGTIASGLSSPARIATDGTNVYWTELSDPGAVKSYTFANGQLRTIGNKSNSFGIFVDASHVYWAENAGAGAGRIVRAPK